MQTTPRSIPRLRRVLSPAVVVIAIAGALACTWRTEHKVETVHKIDAHIVLDIRQIKEEASQIEDYVRDEDATPPPPIPAGDKSSALQPTELALRRVATQPERGWFTFTSAAYAQPVAAEEKLPPVTAADQHKAVEGRKARVKKIEAVLDSGRLGENEHGYLELLIPKDADKAVRQPLEELAKDENKDRNTIYRGIAQRQEDADKALPTVEMVYAGAIREQMKKGQTFQVPKDERFFEEFQKSDLGKAHPGVKRGQWVKKAIDPPKKD
jgi:uncharacterized protein YdbL (DUF1318 family)